MWFDFDINLSDISADRFDYLPPAAKKLKGASAKALQRTINKIEEPPIARSVAIVCLLVKHPAHFQEIPYNEKIELLAELHAVQNIMVYDSHGSNCHGTIGEYVVGRYFHHINNDAQLIAFYTYLKQNHAQLFSMYEFAVYHNLQQSEEAHTFVLNAAKNGIRPAALTLASFQREEDVPILAYHLLGCKFKLGKTISLPQYTGCERHLTFPDIIWNIKLDYLPGLEIVRMRQVSRKWCNEMNDEKTWESMCQRKNLTRVNNLSWMHSYLLLTYNIVTRHPKITKKFILVDSTKYNMGPATGIVKTYPHPLFCSLFSLCPHPEYDQAPHAIASYTPADMHYFMEDITTK